MFYFHNKTVFFFKCYCNNYMTIKQHLYDNQLLIKLRGNFTVNKQTLKIE